MAPPIDPDSPSPLHRQLADLLRADIATGRLTGKLPSEAQLRRSHEVELSRDTVRRALLILRDEDLIESTQGRGWFVKRRPQQAL
ncbi:MAG TPA: winged helix-turn-helix domain-containing protein [Trebonia sp.]|nr:winged helix-turn-helix domain-containing protein [Trebonia sp.]